KDRAVQVVRCWSFQRPDQADLAQEVEAWAWGVRALRRSGGIAIAQGRPDAVEAPGDLDVAAVYIAPEPSAKSSAYDVAMRAFEDSDTRIVPVEFDDADEVALRASRLLAAA